MSNKQDLYYLSELYGRIGQILREEGDMPVVRMQDLRLENITNRVEDNYINYSSSDFSIIEEHYVSKDTPELISIEKKFIINIPTKNK